MRVEYTGRQTEVSERIRALTERKLGKLSKLLHPITRVHVILEVEKHRQIAEVSVHSKHLDLTAREEGGDLPTSLSLVLDKLTRQAQRHMEKLRERRRGSSATARKLPAARSDSAEPSRGGAPRVIRTRRFVTKPMTVEEAVLEVGASDVGFLVFRDAATERVSVLYRRSDGNLGLIEPGA